MKTVALLAALTLLPASAVAQGTITFNNTVNTLVTWAPGMPFSGPVSFGQAIRVGLYYFGSNGFTLVSPTPYVGFILSGQPVPPIDGRFLVGTVRVPGLPAGQTGTFQVRAWSGGFSSYEAAVAGGAVYGAVSPNFPNPSGGVLDASGVPSAAASFNMPAGFQIAFIPEPSTVALAMLGLCVLVLCGALPMRSDH